MLIDVFVLIDGDHVKELILKKYKWANLRQSLLRRMRS